MKKFSRIASFWIITIVYILAAAIGIGIYLWLPYAWWLKLLIADVAAAVVTFLFSLLFQNASVYDPYWSVQPIVIVLTLALGQTLTPLRIMLIGAICLSVAAVILQGTADFQMHRFRRKKTGGFIHDGLWKYSRHPNYLGEILMWWGVALAVGCTFPDRWYLYADTAGE